MQFSFKNGFIPCIRQSNYLIFKECFKMTKYVCPCGYVYDPEIGDPDNGIAPGTPWEEVPEDFVCPVCGLGKDMFEAE